MATVMQKESLTFAEFYPLYLSEHSNRICRELHFSGATLSLLCLAALLLTGNWWWLAGALISGVGLSWAGHLLFEKNRPTTARHPVYSFMGSWVMYWQMLTGQTSF